MNSLLDRNEVAFVQIQFEYSMVRVLIRECELASGRDRGSFDFSSSSPLSYDLINYSLLLEETSYGRLPIRSDR